MVHKLINANCLDYLAQCNHVHVDTIFADPPDNIGAKYSGYVDRMPAYRYEVLMDKWLRCFLWSSNTVWLSYNSRWAFMVGSLVWKIIKDHDGKIEAKNCVQTFTFGQHRQSDLGNNHRLLLRLRWIGIVNAPLFPDAIRVQSWRQKNGDKRADPRGRVPGDVFDFPRVTGNSKQRRRWHPTQLHEDLVERCVKLTTPPGGTVLDPFGGTGTTLRVCKRTGHECTLVELDTDYCSQIAMEHAMERHGNLDDGLTWTCQTIHKSHVCEECGKPMVRTSEDFMSCPDGHGRLQPAQ